MFFILRPSEGDWRPPTSISLTPTTAAVAAAARRTAQDIGGHDENPDELRTIPPTNPRPYDPSGERCQDSDMEECDGEVRPATAPPNHHGDVADQLAWDAGNMDDNEQK